MVKEIFNGNVVASKLVKTWGTKGKVTKTYGSSRSKKFDVEWDDGTTTLGASSRAISLLSDLGPKPVPASKKRKRIVQTDGVDDGESSADESSSGDSDGSSTNASGADDSDDMAR